MQEALTNVHRHSGSRRVDIVLKTDQRKAVLVIRDFGKGIPKDVLERFKQSGTNVGVGLAGIRERVKELGGNFNIHSNGKGTTLEVSIPIADRAQNVYSAGSGSQIYSSLAG
jgi:two-component system NarL family sensor kinase